MRSITYTSRRTTETHRLLVLIPFLNGLIEHNVTQNTGTPYDLTYISKPSYTTLGWLDLIGLKNMKIIKERVLLNNRCCEVEYKNAVDEYLKETAKLLIIPLNIYINLFVESQVSFCNLNFRFCYNNIFNLVLIKSIHICLALFLF